jgi:NAD+ diphosphatase
MLDLETPQPADRSDALLFVFVRGRLISDLRSPEGPLMRDAQLREYAWDVRNEQFVGHWRGEPCFAVEVDHGGSLDPLRHQEGSLYHLVGRVEDDLFALAGRALQLLSWQRDHRYCGRCGQEMGAAEGERAMRCDSCELLVYPRISPCVITLVTRGEEMLLAQAARFRRPMFSTLAGFIEAGESAEDTLRREVREEVGIEVDDLTYFGSQPWPFPNQLMLGYFAEYAAGEIRPDDNEIAEARWFHPSELPPIPPSASIAGQLIRHHCREVLGANFDRSR